MLTNLFTPNISVAVAFLAGLASFLSPCVFPLIPSYLSYISGISVDTLASNHTLRSNTSVRLSAVKHSLLFIFGFTIIFVLLGVFSGSIGAVLHSIWAMRISGVFIVLMGLFILGAFNKIKFLSFLSRDVAFNLKNKPVGYAGSILVGMIFAGAWTPCIGPILASILFISASMHDTALGGYLLFVYSMGLALPFLISAISLNLFLLAFKKVKKAVKVISVVSGVVLIIMGILIFFNYLTVVSAFLTR